MKKFGSIFIEVDGKLTNIQDLPKSDYERFLEGMRSLMVMYKVLTEKGDR